MKVDNELDYEYSGMKCSRVHCTWGALLGSDFCPECLERMGDTQEMSDKPDTVAISRECAEICVRSLIKAGFNDAEAEMRESIKLSKGEE